MGAPLVGALEEDFPLRPELAPVLIPANINLWMGRSRDGASSGLHHDYHDNLYLLLRGRKCFDLFSPKHAEALYPRGDLVRVHKNGRINYAGKETFADGHDEASEKAVAAFKQLKAAEMDAEDEDEDKLDAALEAVLDAEMAGQDDEDFDDDFDDEEDDCEPSFGDGDEGTDDPRALGAALDFSERSAGEAALGKPKAEGANGGRGAAEEQEKTPPDNFSRIDLSQPREAILRGFPRFHEAKQLECEFQEGSMLYLPAGWFHNVTSFSGEDKSGVHMALNYWFHPPDGTGLAKPYSTDFWQEAFAERFGPDGPGL
uniref:JmjC domain-containing protein n=1 Tax=Phaeomonas parva TaxID=124430 RepID=A0A7S1XRY0_9STRA